MSAAWDQRFIAILLGTRTFPQEEWQDLDGSAAKRISESPRLSVEWHASDKQIKEIRERLKKETASRFRF